MGQVLKREATAGNQLESQGLLTIIMGEPAKGSHERTVGSWLAARGHLEKATAGLGTGDFFL